jgi:hypothetical protein
MNFIIKLLKFVESLHYITSHIYHLDIPYMKYEVFENMAKF